MMAPKRKVGFDSLGGRIIFNGVVDSLKVYEILKAAQISEPQAKAIAHAIKQAESEIAQDVRTVLDERIKHLVTKADLAESKAELMRWMFIFWLGQAAATIGIIATALKLMR